MKQYDINHDMRYLQLLAQSFPSIAEASTEIINLQAILNLPKGTEHFLADIHGEYEAFLHVLKNASGNIKRKRVSNEPEGDCEGGGPKGKGRSRRKACNER